jgi:hypothetical protein
MEYCSDGDSSRELEPQGGRVADCKPFRRGPGRSSLPSAGLKIE